MSEQTQLFDIGVIARVRDRRGSKPTCHCGICRKCRRRESNRDYARLYYHGIRRPRQPKPKPKPKPETVWTREEDALLGTDVDRVVAQRLAKSMRSVYTRRTRLGIPRFSRTQKGYLAETLMPDDPLRSMARHDGSVQKHRLVMARHLDRPLTRDEFVHHRNGVKTDNAIENLELWARQHPDGQRVEDLVRWAIAVLERYGDEAERLGFGSIFNRGIEG